METKRLTYRNLEIAAQLLKEGGIVAFPTETVYGLAVIYNDEAAYKRLVEVKRRRPDKPFTLMCASKEDIFKFVHVSDITRTVIESFLPGPLTIVLPALPDTKNWLDLGTGKIGIRVSNMQTIQELIIKVEQPLLVPSANRADEPPALSGEETLALFDGEIDGVIMGTVTGGRPSTVIEIDAEDHIKLLRKGPLSLEEIIAKTETGI